MLRKARISDVKGIHELINRCAGRGEMLPRPLAELYDNIRDYLVYEDQGQVGGTCALHICWEDLAEIRSLAVSEGLRKQGIGRSLVETCLKEAKGYGIERVFLLTYQEVFFRKLGFVLTDKKELPHKIWTDCIKCSKFPECDESAMIKMII